MSGQPRSTGRAKIPIGKRITFDGDQSERPTWLTVIGVAANAKQSEMASEPYPEVYLAALQNRTYLTDGKPQPAYITLVVRTAGRSGRSGACREAGRVVV